MYPASLHMIPTQIVDSSEVLAKCIPKATANIQEYYKEMGQKHN